MYNKFVNITLVNGNGYAGFQVKIGDKKRSGKYTPGITDESLRKSLKERNKIFNDLKSASKGVLLEYRDTIPINSTIDNIPKHVCLGKSSDGFETIKLYLRNLKTHGNTTRTLKVCDYSCIEEMVAEGIRIINANSLQYNDIAEKYNSIRLKKFNKYIEIEEKTLRPMAYQLLRYSSSIWKTACLNVVNKGFKDSVEYIV